MFNAIFRHNEQISFGGRSCQFCGSDNLAEFAAEMIIHFSGLKNLDKPGIMVFPRLLVCLDCGISCFTAPKSALALLAQDTATSEISTPNCTASGLGPHPARS